MQRHRDEEIGAGQDFAPGAVHPPPERMRHMGPVAVLQGEDEPAAVPVVTQHGACAIPAAPISSAFGAYCILAHWVRKGHAADHTPGRSKEGHAAPAT